jgi:tRNA threonylcarbamoyl adenosine modification protein YeaZ
MTTILAMDCATGPCSVAVWNGDQITAYVENLKPVMQSVSLIPMIEDALLKAGITYKDIQLVAATVGPGSFTGIRVGLAAAQGIAYAAGIEARGFTTLDVLAFAQKQPSLAILNAGKGECYYQYTTPMLGTLEQALSQAPSQPFIISGNVAVTAEGFIQSEIAFPRADILAKIAATNAPFHHLKPFYIRPPDAKLPSQRKG